nr:MAG TPA: Rubrerythrin, rubrerythrin, peroxidase, peroxide, oxidized [Caudoviricetes sp.]
MRLIDADSLLKELKDDWPAPWTDSDIEIQQESDFAWFEAMIDAAPTVHDTEGLVEAEWILENNRYYCSACEMPALARWPDKYAAEEFLTRRCPECGARMKNGG